MSSINSQIRDAIDSYDIDGARKLLRDALKDPDAETFYLASLVSLDDEQKRGFLDSALKLDPFHVNARNSLKEMTDPSRRVAVDHLPRNKEIFQDATDSIHNRVSVTQATLNTSATDDLVNKNRAGSDEPTNKLYSAGIGLLIASPLMLYVLHLLSQDYADGLFNLHDIALENCGATTALHTNARTLCVDRVVQAGYLENASSSANLSLLFFVLTLIALPIAVITAYRFYMTYAQKLKKVR